MPFPPTFDHVWDLTQPPDTQLASLGAQDFRNLKDDVMQRLSLLSGTLANRPTPETVNATWGGAGFGLLYFATDTGQIFQWSGSAWAEVTNLVGVRRLVNLTPVVFASGAGTGTGQTLVIPAGLLVPGNLVNIQARILLGSGCVFVGGSPVFSLFFGATKIATAAFASNLSLASTVYGYVSGTVAVVSAAAQRVALTTNLDGILNILAPTVDPTENTANAITIKDTYDTTVNGGSITYDILSAWIG